MSVPIGMGSSSELWRFASTAPPGPSRIVYQRFRYSKVVSAQRIWFRDPGSIANRRTERASAPTGVANSASLNRRIAARQTSVGLRRPAATQMLMHGNDARNSSCGDGEVWFFRPQPGKHASLIVRGKGGAIRRSFYRAEQAVKRLIRVYPMTLNSVACSCH